MKLKPKSEWMKLDRLGGKEVMLTLNGGWKGARVVARSKKYPLFKSESVEFYLGVDECGIPMVLMVSGDVGVYLAKKSKRRSVR